MTYNEDKKTMFCMLCVKHRLKNGFCRGSSNFRRSALLEHAVTSSHVEAVKIKSCRFEYMGKKRQIFTNTKSKIL